MKTIVCEEALALIGEMLGGTLTPEDAVSLEAHLAACPDCRSRSESYCVLDRALWEMAAQARISELLPAAVRRAPVVRRSLWLGMLAAAVALAVAVGLWQYEHRSDPLSSAIALVKANLHGQWAAGREVVEGAPVVAGAWELQSGLVELQVASGTSLLIEAPASFELLDTRHVRLLAGSLVVRMSKGESGFVVEMPQMRVTDLGTEFGTSVASDGQSRVQVFDGKVRAESRGLTGHRELTAGEALTSTQAGGLTSLAFRENRFIRCFPPRKPGQWYLPLYNKSNLEMVYVPPAPAKVRIDGDLSDWNRAGVFHAACTPPYEHTYFLDAMMMYDAEKLYLGAHVADPEPMRNTAPDEKADYAGGSVIVRVSTDRAQGWPLTGTRMDWRGHFNKALTPECTNNRVVHISMWYDAAAARPRLKLFYGFDLHGASIDPPGWEGTFRKNADGRGYTLEYAIPWRLLNCADDPPRSGDALAAVWTVHWSDADGRICRGYLVEVTNHSLTGRPRYSYEHGPSWGRALYLPEK